MRILLTLGAALAVSACGGGGETQSNEANLTASDNMMLDQNLTMDPAMNGTANMAMDPAMNGAANGTVDPATQNMIQQDMNTNDPDTNLANGM